MNGNEEKGGSGEGSKNMEKKVAIMRKVLTCLVIIAILMSAIPVSVVAVVGSNNSTKSESDLPAENIKTILAKSSKAQPMVHVKGEVVNTQTISISHADLETYCSLCRCGTHAPPCCVDYEPKNAGNYLVLRVKIEEIIKESPLTLPPYLSVGELSSFYLYNPSISVSEGDRVEIDIYHPIIAGMYSCVGVLIIPDKVVWDMIGKFKIIDINVASGTRCGKITNWKTDCTSVQLGGKFGAEMEFDNLMAGGYRFKGIVRVRSPTDEEYSGENQPRFVPSSPNNHGKFAGGNTLYVRIPEGAATGKYDVKLELWNVDTNESCDDTGWKENIFTVEDGGAVSEIVFTGTAIEYHEASGFGAPFYWTVNVDKVIRGTQPCSTQIDVITYAAINIPWGYADPNIVEGDKVEVYGKYYEDQYGCGVTLGDSNDYYIKKSQGSGSIKITSVSPLPGTTLNAGDTVTFTVNVDYDLGPSDHGKILLSVNQYTTGITDKEHSIGIFDPHSGSYTFNHTETIGDDWENVYVSVSLYAAKQGEPLPTPYTDFDYKQYQVGRENKIIEVDDDFVDDPPNHKWDTIQEGVNDANEGDTVLVYSGTYYENVIVNKPIILVGEDKNTTIIDGGGSGDVVRITAKNCVVKGFLILNGGSNWEGSGIEVSWFSPNVTIENNIIGMEGKTMYYGIDIWSCDNIVIRNNFIQYTNYGVNGAFFSKGTIEDNHINRAGGITLTYVNDTLIQGNYISNGDTGIHLDSAYNNKLQYNNIISHNNYGVHIWNNSNNNTIVGNNISDNSLGIYISLSTFGNRIYHNNLIDNNAPIDYGTNFWDNGYPSGGNYWSDYRVKYPNAKEIDDSGIWDTPYEISGGAGAKDNYPLMEPWGEEISNMELTLYIEDAITPEGVPPMVNKASGDIIDIIAQVMNEEDKSCDVNVTIRPSHEFELIKNFIRDNFIDTDENEVSSIVSEDITLGDRYTVTLSLGKKGTKEASKQVVWRFKTPEEIEDEHIVGYVISGEVEEVGGFVCSKSEVGFNVVRCVKSIIVTNRHLLFEKYGDKAGGSSEDVGNMLNYLYQIGNPDDQNCIIYYVDHYNEDLNKWGQNVDYGSEVKANKDATIIDDLIEDNFTKKTNPPYLMIVGGDEIIPFYRVEAVKSGYSPREIACGYSEVTKNGYYFTDNVYADTRDNNWKLGSLELAVGRIVGRSASNITILIENGINKATTSNNVVVNSWDRVDVGSIPQSGDYAPDANIPEVLSNKGYNVKVKNGDCTYDNDDWDGQVLINGMSNGYDIFIHGDHASYYTLDLAQSDCFTRSISTTFLDSKYYSATEWDSNNQLQAYHPIIATMGCHAALIPENLNPHSISLTFLERGASSYMGSTSYGTCYCDPKGAGKSDYAEKLVQKFVDELSGSKTQDSIEIGEAFRLAKKHSSYDKNTNRGIRTSTAFVSYGVPWHKLSFPKTAKQSIPVNTMTQKSTQNEIKNPKVTISKPTYVSPNIYKRIIEITATEFTVTDEDGYNLLHMQNATNIYSNGKPVIPYVCIKIFLPKESEIIDTSLKESHNLSAGDYNIPCYSFEEKVENTSVLDPNGEIIELPKIVSSGVYTDCNTRLGLYPDPIYSANLIKYKEDNVVTIKSALFQINPETRNVTLFNYTKLEVTYKTQNSLMITDFALEKTEYATGETINTSVGIENVYSDTLTGLRANLSLKDSHGIVKASSLYAPFNVASGESKTIYATLSQSLPHGSYLAEINVINRTGDTLGSSSEYIYISTGRITDFSLPSEVESEEDITFNITFKNSNTTSVEAIGVVYIYDPHDIEIAKLPSLPVTVASDSEELISISWSTVGKEIGKYKAVAYVFANAEAFGSEYRAFEITRKSILPNMLKNPDFEDQLLYWGDTKDSAIYTASDQEPHGGFYCAKGVEVNKGNLGRLYQDVTGLVNAGNKYKIGGWIKTEDVVGNVVIALNYVDENGWCPANGYVKEIGHVTGTTDWTYYESEWFILPPMPKDGVATWFLFDFNNGRGTAYWDDVSLLSNQKIIYVDDDFTDDPANHKWDTIQEGINDANERDTIIVRDGIYTENIDVNKPHLTIMSENGAGNCIVHAANPADNVFEVTVDYVTICGFTIEGANKGGGLSGGIHLSSVNYCIISNNNLSNNWNGIELCYSNGNEISKNCCLNNKIGIGLEFSSNNSISKNDYRANKNGIALETSHNNLISDNNGLNNDYDIDLDHSNNNLITRNNCCSNNNYGISLRDSSDNNIIFLNNFINNGDNVFSSDSANIWNSPSKITYTYKGKTYKKYLGNYWDDYTGLDANGNGIGDTPYNINSDKDNYPLMQSWENYFGVYKPGLKITITSDKEEYPPGDDVFITMKFKNEGEETVLIANPITTTFIASDGPIVLEEDLSSSISVTLGAGGQWSFGTSYKLPDDAPEGYYDVKVSISGGKYVKTLEDLFFVVKKVAYNFDGFPVETRTHGTVNGGVFIDYEPWAGTTTLTGNFDAPKGNVKWARLYTGIWSGAEDYAGWVNVVFNGVYDRNGLGPIHLQGKNDCNPNVWCSGHGKYWIYYDVTDLVNAGATNTANVSKINATVGSFDGRVYGIVLVVVYEGGDNPKDIQYWINDGSDGLNYVTPLNEGTTYFEGAVDTGIVNDAKLTMVHLTGYDPSCANCLKFNDNPLDTSVVDNTFELNIWDVKNYLASSGNSAWYSRGEDPYVNVCNAILVLET